LNVIALPRDWANYGEILDLFAERYPEITITEASPSHPLHPRSPAFIPWRRRPRPTSPACRW
ncbi:MAG TPA: hypothetical protein VFF77_00065, partial [Holophagaceae bacterium]|nr:hypothetical protein [Holophagaceae bacterium]